MAACENTSSRMRPGCRHMGIGPIANLAGHCRRGGAADGGRPTARWLAAPGARRLRRVAAGGRSSPGGCAATAMDSACCRELRRLVAVEAGPPASKACGAPLLAHAPTALFALLAMAEIAAVSDVWTGGSVQADSHTGVLGQTRKGCPFGSRVDGRQCAGEHPFRWSSSFSGGSTLSGGSCSARAEAQSERLSASEVFGRRALCSIHASPVAGCGNIQVQGPVSVITITFLYNKWGITTILIYGNNPARPCGSVCAHIPVRTT